jgi:hypothetical protein
VRHFEIAPLARHEGANADDVFDRARRDIADTPEGHPGSGHLVPGRDEET